VYNVANIIGDSDNHVAWIAGEFDISSDKHGEAWITDFNSSVVWTLSHTTLPRYSSRLVQNNPLYTQALTKAGQIHPNSSPCRLPRMGRDKRALRHPRNLHNRYLRPTKSTTSNIPTNGDGNVLHRIQLLDPGEQPQRAPRMYHHWHIHLRHRLLNRRGTSPIHILSRSIPAIRAVIWNGASNSHNMVLRFHSWCYLAVGGKGVHASGSVFLVCGLVLGWVVIGSYVRA